jgi:HlyD family secretion protein
MQKNPGATPDTKLEMLSQEMNDLVSYRPNWIIRKGNMVFLAVLLLLLTISWFIKYPDIVKGSVRLVAINAPRLVTARTEGKLEKLLVANGAAVKEGEPLAYLQSTARHEEVLTLYNWINETETAIIDNNLEILLVNPLPVLLQLGEVQVAFEQFQSGYYETLQLLKNGYYQKKKKALLQDLQYLADIQHSTERQKQLLQKDISLQQQELNAKEALAKEKIIAPLEFNQDISKSIGKEQSLELLTAQLINNNIVEHNKRKEILDLQKFITDQQHHFRSELLTLKSTVEQWKERYVMSAPLDGTVLFVSFLQENQLLASNQELFYVQPPRTSYYGELMAGQYGLGKIKIGQRVLIRMESFPSAEYGHLDGRVEYVSDIANRHDSFLINVDLPRGLSTSYNKQVIFRNNLSATAEIITDDRRLLQRLLNRWNQLTQR